MILLDLYIVISGQTFLLKQCLLMLVGDLCFKYIQIFIALCWRTKILESGKIITNYTNLKEKMKKAKGSSSMNLAIL